MLHVVDGVFFLEIENLSSPHSYRGSEENCLPTVQFVRSAVVVEVHFSARNTHTNPGAAHKNMHNQQPVDGNALAAGPKKQSSCVRFTVGTATQRMVPNFSRATGGKATSGEGATPQEASFPLTCSISAISFPGEAIFIRQKCVVLSSSQLCLRQVHMCLWFNMSCDTHYPEHRRDCRPEAYGLAVKNICTLSRLAT